MIGRVKGKLLVFSVFLLGIGTGAVGAYEYQTRVREPRERTVARPRIGEVTVSLVRHRGRTKARRVGAGVASTLVAIVGLLALPTPAAAQIDDVRVVMIASDESPDVARSLGELSARLAEIAGRRSDLADPLESVRRSLERLASAARAPGEIEESLVRLDRRLTGALYEALSDAERTEIEGRIEKQMAVVRDRMDDETARRTRKALARRLLREGLELPRLTLL